VVDALALACQVAWHAAALIVGKAAQRATGRPNQRHPLLGGDVLRTEPSPTPKTADHRVLVAHRVAAGGVALRRDEQRGGPVCVP